MAAWKATAPAADAARKRLPHVPVWEAGCTRGAHVDSRAQKLKSFFSLIGVLIGVTFLIAVVSIVQGMNVYMTDKFAGTIIGINTFQLRQRPDFVLGPSSQEQWREWNRRPRITIEDAAWVEDRMKTPARFARESGDNVSIGWHGKMAQNIGLSAVDAEYFKIKHWNIGQGRAFTPQEVNVGAEVVVLGWELADKLFEGRDPIGQIVSVGGLPHRVIGVVEPQGTLFGMSLDKFAITPATSPARALVNRPHVLDDLQIQTLDPADMPAAIDEVTALMRVRHGLKPGQPDNFHIETADGALTEWKKISQILFLALPGLVAISLVVGGIVIMNIMLMAVAGADARDRHPEGSWRQAARHHGAVRDRIGDALAHRRRTRHWNRSPARLRGACLDAASGRRGTMVDWTRRRTRDPRGHGGGSLPRTAGREARPDHRPGARMSRLGRGNLFARAFEGVSLGVGALRGNKTRASLTILGIAIGVMVVLAMASTITGIQHSVSAIVERAGPKTFYVIRYFREGIQFDDGNAAWRKRPPLSRDEAEMIRQLPTVGDVNVRENGTSRVAYRDKEIASTGIDGMDASWMQVQGGEILSGRNFNPVEAAGAAFVVVINDKAVESLFKRGDDPIGKAIKIFGAPFTVVGVYQDPTGLFQNGGGSPHIVIPHRTFVNTADFTRGWLSIAVIPRHEATQGEVDGRGHHQHAPAPEPQAGTRTTPSTSYIERSSSSSFNSMTSGFFLVMRGTLRAVGLLVGGVGVIAIMMISVTERTREIGVRKALGAPPAARSSSSSSWKRPR